MTSVYMQNPAYLYWGALEGKVNDAALHGYNYYGSTWQSITHAYLYGTHYWRLTDHQVEFENPLLPAGAVIYRWDEVYNYVSGKSVPSLPLLKRERYYQLTVHAKLDLAGGVYLRVLFFNFAGKRVGMQIIHSLAGTFHYPAAADFYAIELVSAGAKKMTFSRMDLVEVKGPEERLGDAELDARWQADQAWKGVAVATLDRLMKEEVDG